MMLRSWPGTISQWDQDERWMAQTRWRTALVHLEFLPKAFNLTVEKLLFLGDGSCCGWYFASAACNPPPCSLQY